MLDRHPCQQKPRIAQPREVRSYKLASLLAFPTFRRKIGGQCTDVFINGAGFHR
jgi:hypothetical protein